MAREFLFFFLQMLQLYGSLHDQEDWFCKVKEREKERERERKRVL